MFDDDEAATLEDVDRFVYENFKLFYVKDDDDDDDDNDADARTKNGGYDREDDDDERTEEFSLKSPRLMDSTRWWCGFVKGV
ncbi:hypothetical protein U1Q18_034941 [Sarracenia purpurea var. burkii]